MSNTYVPHGIGGVGTVEDSVIETHVQEREGGMHVLVEGLPYPTNMQYHMTGVGVTEKAENPLQVHRPSNALAASNANVTTCIDRKDGYIPLPSHLHDLHGSSVNVALGVGVGSISHILNNVSAHSSSLLSANAGLHGNMGPGSSGVAVGDPDNGYKKGDTKDIKFNLPAHNDIVTQFVDSIRRSQHHKTEELLAQYPRQATSSFNAEVSHASSAVSVTQNLSLIPDIVHTDVSQLLNGVDTDIRVDPISSNYYGQGKYKYGRQEGNAVQADFFRGVDLEYASSVKFDEQTRKKHSQLVIGKCALHITVDSGNHIATELQLKKKANPNQLSPDLESPLMAATINGYTNICAQLLEYNADYQYVHPRNGMSALHVAACFNKPQIMRQIFLHCDEALGTKDMKRAQAIRDYIQLLKDAGIHDINPNILQNSKASTPQSAGANSEHNFACFMPNYTNVIEKYLWNIAGNGKLASVNTLPQLYTPTARADSTENRNNDTNDCNNNGDNSNNNDNTDNRSSNNNNNNNNIDNTNLLGEACAQNKTNELLMCKVTLPTYPELTEMLAEDYLFCDSCCLEYGASSNCAAYAHLFAFMNEDHTILANRRWEASAGDDMHADKEHGHNSDDERDDSESDGEQPLKQTELSRKSVFVDVQSYLHTLRRSRVDSKSLGYEEGASQSRVPEYHISVKRSDTATIGFTPLQLESEHQLQRNTLLHEYKAGATQTTDPFAYLGFAMNAGTCCRCGSYFSESAPLGPSYGISSLKLAATIEDLWAFVGPWVERVRNKKCTASLVFPDVQFPELKNGQEPANSKFIGIADDFAVSELFAAFQEQAGLVEDLTSPHFLSECIVNPELVTFAALSYVTSQMNAEEFRGYLKKTNTSSLAELIRVFCSVRYIPKSTFKLHGTNDAMIPPSITNPTKTDADLKTYHEIQKNLYQHAEVHEEESVIHDNVTFTAYSGKSILTVIGVADCMRSRRFVSLNGNLEMGKAKVQFQRYWNQFQCQRQLLTLETFAYDNVVKANRSLSAIMQRNLYGNTVCDYITNSTQEYPEQFHTTLSYFIEKALTPFLAPRIPTVPVSVRMKGAAKRKVQYTQCCGCVLDRDRYREIEAEAVSLRSQDKDTSMHNSIARSNTMSSTHVPNDTHVHHNSASRVSSFEGRDMPTSIKTETNHTEYSSKQDPHLYNQNNQELSKLFIQSLRDVSKTCVESLVDAGKTPCMCSFIRCSNTYSHICTPEISYISFPSDQHEPKLLLTTPEIITELITMYLVDSHVHHKYTVLSEEYPVQINEGCNMFSETDKTTNTTILREK